MYDIPSGLTEYVRFIRGGAGIPNGAVPPDCNEFYKIALDLTKNRFKRKRLIKKLFDVLLSSQYITHFQLKFKQYVKAKAYMTDAGTVCFSSAHVRRTRGAMLVKLVFHEVAHLWLSQRPEYSKLKALQREFDTVYGNLPEAAALAPIEYYAIGLSTVMLERLATIAQDRTQHDGIIQQIEREKAKLNDFTAIID